MRNLIWQPFNLNSLDEFGILLNRHFAMRMIHSTLSRRQRGELRELGLAEVMELEHTESPAFPFSFYQGTALLENLYLLRGDVPVLSLDLSKGIPRTNFVYGVPSEVKYLKDKTSVQRLFEFWADYVGGEFGLPNF